MRKYLLSGKKGLISGLRRQKFNDQTNRKSLYTQWFKIDINRNLAADPKRYRTAVAPKAERLRHLKDQLKARARED
jgi:hypothetical protein